MSGTSLEPDESQDIKFYHAHDDNDIWRWYSLSFTVWVKLKCRIKENGSRSAPKANRAWLHLTLGRSRFRLTKTSEMHTRCIKCTKTSKNHPAQRLSKLQWRFIASHRIICHTTCQQCGDIVESHKIPDIQITSIHIREAGLMLSKKTARHLWAGADSRHCSFLKMSRTKLRLLWINTIGNSCRFLWCCVLVKCSFNLCLSFQTRYPPQRWWQMSGSLRSCLEAVLN